MEPSLGKVSPAGMGAIAGVRGEYSPNIDFRRRTPGIAGRYQPVGSLRRIEMVRSSTAR